MNGNGNGALVHADDLLGLTPPHNVEAERAALGAMLLDPLAIDVVGEQLKPADFYGPAHAAIFQAIQDLRAQGKGVDSVTLVEEMRRRGTLDGVGGPVAISNLLSVVPTSANGAYYAEIVHEKAVHRRAIVGVAEAQRHLTTSTDPLPERLERVEKLVLEATRLEPKQEDQSMGAVLAQVFAKIEARKNGQRLGVPFGLAELDRLTDGMRPGDLTILAARPAVGKSTLALNIVRNVAGWRRADRADLAAVLVSLEMPGDEIMLNLLCSIARVDAFAVRSRRITDADHRSLLDAAERVELMKLAIDTPAYLTPTKLRSKARRWKAEKRCDLLCVDYLQLMSGSQHSSRSRQEEVSEISRSLKAIAVELNIPVLALAQLNRQVEDRVDHKPRMSDLRESGALEADASLVLLLHRPDYYMTREEAEAEGVLNKAEVIVAKNRYGATGTASLFFDKTTSFFADADRGST